MIKKATYRPAVFVAIYKKQEGKIFYLVLKRKKHWKGWEFTKGGVDSGESYLQTAKRECYEESGLKPIKLMKFRQRGKYRYSKTLNDRPGYIGQTYKLFAAQVNDNLGKKQIKIDKKEHSTYRWLEFNQAFKILRWGSQKKCLKIVNNFLTR